jgi:hypothetical protein
MNDLFTKISHWVIYLVCCLFILSGRYEWSEQVFPFSLRSYLYSSFMFILVMPTMVFTLKQFIHDMRFVWMYFILGTVLFILPFHWLGISTHESYFQQPLFYPAQEYQNIEFHWVSQGLNFTSIPLEKTFFAFLILTGVLIILTLSWWKKANRFSTLLALTLYILLPVQMWLHLSDRSPGVYIEHFAHPGEEVYYHVYLYEHQQAAVNMDYWMWISLDANFLGVPYEITTAVLRRSFPAYLTHHFFIFLAPYYIYLMRNLIFWAAALISSWQVMQLWGFSRKTAAYFVALLSCGAGFISFSTEPAAYLPGVAIIMILIYLFELLLVQNKDLTFNHCLFGVHLAIGYLTYDIFPYVIFFLLYGKFQKIPLFRSGISICVSVIIYILFLSLYALVPDNTIQSVSDHYIRQSILSVLSTLSSFNPESYYLALLRVMSTFFSYLLSSFLVLPVLLSLLGLVFIQRKETGHLILALFCPVILMHGFLQLGNTDLSHQARFLYNAYPGVYLLAAIALARVEDWLSGKAGKRIARGIVGMILLLNGIIANMDSLGFPQIYVSYFYSVFV